MESSQAIPAISAWRGEFIEPAIERAYRKHKELSTARHLRKAIKVWAVLLLLFGLLDYPALGMSESFMLLMGLRIATVVLLAVLFVQVKRKPELATAAYAVTAIEIFGFVLFFFLYFIRHDIVTWVIGMLPMMLISLYVFVPNRVVLSNLVAAFCMVGMLYVVALNGFGAATLIGLFFLLALPSVVGFFTALRLQIAQRQEYAQFQRVSEINVELQSEIVRRQALEEELKRQATTDPLTGLFNRRQYEILFNRERDRCSRQNLPLSLCVVDLDHFKKVNDNYGHDVGDLVLKHVANLFSKTLRHMDVVGRFGGEEFILILPETDLEHALQVVNRLREELMASSVQSPKGEIKMTATCGVTLVASDDVDVAAVIKRADMALYEGKKAGRNRVVTA